ncbi:Npt1/Npt2 family nucleotide transporter [Paenibacillus eucommiae]|uniref:ADP,ATP carrier protein n=1 Tax=Paenibacillus eucommiae TaxID=1355755 RepID=A0ABS4IUX2_9BACL|nr:Npt1/Npt2 family nucleotide transporter [Paenibacillus eucommiae]MBP1991388.1 CRP-like cAMP-binding protein/ATP/ADP translocase/HEAT repeat protein [Paenibacillus eucommiae]
MLTRGASESRWQTSLRNLAADKQEYIKISLLFCYLFCVVSASTIGRTAADALFLSHFSASKLSLMYLPQAATLILVGLLFQKFGSRMRIDRLSQWIILIVALLALGSRFLVGFGFMWVYPLIYVGYDVFNFLMIVCFWQLATSVMDQRKAKKLINWVGSGGIIGGIVSGFGLKLLVQPLGTANLIFLYAGLQLLCLFLVIAIVRKVNEPKETFAVLTPSAKKPVAAKKSGSKQGTYLQAAQGGLFRNVPHLKYVAIISAALVISLTLVDYQFKVILRGSMQNEALAGFMGSFYGYAGLFALIVQFFITSRIISNFGVMTSLLIFPVALFAGSVGVLMLPVLALAVVVKGSDKVIGDTIYSSVGQLIMFPIPPSYRSRAKSFMDGIVRNGAKGIAAISLIVLSPILSIQQFSFLVLGLLGSAIWAVFKVKKAYMDMLMSTLQTRDYNVQDAQLDVMDSVSLKVLVDALNSPEKQQVLYAWRILQGVQGFDLRPYVAVLLEHPVTEVCIEALKYIQLETPEGQESILEAKLVSTDLHVKSHALLALAAYGNDARLDEITAYLQDKQVEVKAAAIAGLIKYYGVEGMFRAVGTFKELIDSDQEDERIAMAALFGAIGISSFYKPIVPLLTDSSQRVRQRALESAAVLRVPELVNYIVPLLNSSVTRQTAIEALAGYEDTVIDLLFEPYWAGADTPLQLPKVYEFMGTQRAFDILLRNYRSASAELRMNIIESLTHLHESGKKADHPIIEGLIIEETDLYGFFVEQGKGFEAVEGYKEVAEAIQHIRANIVERIFSLLGLIYDVKTVNAVYSNWKHGDVRRQANASEVIDQLLHGDLRARITRVMSLVTTSKAMQIDMGRLQSSLVRMYEKQDAWLNQCIKAVLAQNHGTGLKLHVPEISRDPSQDGFDDPQQAVMQMNRVALLRQVTLFAGLSGKDLSAIAEDLKEVAVSSGEIVIQEGDEGDSLFLIQEGMVSVHRNGSKIGGLAQGDCFGEMSVLTEGLRTASVIADTDVLLWRLDSEAFYEIMFDKKKIAIEMMKLSSRRLRNAITRHSDLTAAARSTAMIESEAVMENTDNAAAGNLEVPKTKAVELQQKLDTTDNQVILRRILVLQKIGLFANFNQDDFVRLAKMVEEVPYDAGERICAAGEDGEDMHGIIKGSVRVHRGNETLAVLGEGECFGEMAIIDGEPRSADCTAAEPTLLLMLTREQVFSFCFQRIDVLKGMMRVLAERLKVMQEKG